MKLKLNRTIINSLDFNWIPDSWDEKKKRLLLKPNTTKRPYIIYDASPNVTAGFGIRVGKKSKTYIVQVRVGTKIVKHTLGRHPEFLLESPDLKISARHLAADAVLKLKRGEPLNLIKKEERQPKDGYTFNTLIEDYVEAYKADCLNHQRLPKPNTLQAIQKAQKRLAEWGGKPIQEITSTIVVKKFDELASRAPTAAEQTMRWANAAFRRLIIMEKHKSAQEGRAPLILHNPIEILRDLKKFRSKRELEDSYEKNKIRNPVKNNEQNLGQWLRAVWELRDRNGLGADYLLCTLLLGARRCETAPLKWADRLAKGEKHSIVDLVGRRVLFLDTKNGGDHELPLGEVLHGILQRRHSEIKGDYVFPCRSSRSKAPHYSDPREFIVSVWKKSNIGIKMHDLRRTFATVVNLMEIPNITTKKLLNHSSLADDTSKYAKVTLDDLRIYMQKVEDELLKHVPQIRNDMING